jgi:hypothetical protein
MMTYKAKVKPTLLKWGEGIHPYDTQSHEASGLSKTIEQTIEDFNEVICIGRSFKEVRGVIIGCILIILRVNKQIRGISQATVKYTLTFFNTGTSCSRSFITTLFHSSVHFVPVLVKGLYQTESCSLHKLLFV